MKIFSGKKYKKGFTIMEVILAVAILMAVMGIAIPGIVRLSDELKIAKLDDIAREIYTSAQSQAVSLSVGGQLSQVEGNDAKSDEESGAPEETTVKYKYVYRAGTSNTIGNIDMLLPWGSIEEGVRQNSYIIEYNPATAMIRGVYYWENEDAGFASAVTSGYENKTLPTDKDGRMDYSGGMVGYFSGDDVNGRLSAGSSNVKAGLVNDEELYLTILQGLDEHGIAPINGTITITLTDLDKGVSREIASFKNEGYVVNDTPVTNGSLLDYPNIRYYAQKMDSENTIPAHFKLTLDSLKPELRFSKLFLEGADGSFHPGCNLKVTVSFQEEGKQVQEESFLTNSLFASVEGGYTDGASEPSRTAYISCGRHLENLGVLWVYSDKAEDMSDTLNGVTKAVQTANIDWEQSLGKVEDVDGALPFKPIVNGALKEFDGGGNTISLDIHGDVKEDVLKGYAGTDGFGIGLFSEFKGDKLENINLVDCTVKGLTGHEPNDLYVGLLAGRIDKAGGTCKITDCHAYATVDATSGNVSDCFIEAPGNSVGGLLGSIQGAGGNVEMEKCSASLTKIAGNALYVGGLAGSIDRASVIISQCYADTGVRSSADNEWKNGMSGTNVGGLLGSIAGTGSFTLENSYAVGGISTATKAYGLVGAANGSGVPTIQKCYAALLKGKDIVEELVPKSLESAIEPSSCINYSGVYSDFDSLVEDGGAYIWEKDTTKRAQATCSYGIPETDVSEGAYPFPRLQGMLHYGDWPQEINGVQIAYFEVYQKDGTYNIGFYSKEPNKETFDTLMNDEAYTVVMDGYAVMFPVKEGKYGGMDMGTLLSNEPDLPKLIVHYNGTEVGAGNLKLMNAENKFAGLNFDAIGIDSTKGIEITTGEGKEKSYSPLFLSSAMMVEGEGSLTKPDSYYQKLMVEIKTDRGTEPTEPLVNVYFNPYVAKSDFVEVTKTTSGTASEPPAVPDCSILRTSRQITAYTSFKAMQNTAIGDGTVVTDGATGETKTRTHTLRLERNIRLTEAIKTDSTIAGGNIGCKDLSIPAGTNILELNGKTLDGTGTGYTVSSLGGQLTVYGYTAESPGGNSTENPGSTTEGTIANGGVYMKDGAAGTLINVTINQVGDSVNMEGDITLDGCSIIYEE